MMPHSTKFQWCWPSVVLKIGLVLWCPPPRPFLYLDSPKSTPPCPSHSCGPCFLSGLWALREYPVCFPLSTRRSVWKRQAPNGRELTVLFSFCPQVLRGREVSGCSFNIVATPFYTLLCRWGANLELCFPRGLFPEWFQVEFCHWRHICEIWKAEEMEKSFLSSIALGSSDNKGLFP